jgi:hypothetical protein
VVSLLDFNSTHSFKKEKIFNSTRTDRARHRQRKANIFELPLKTLLQPPQWQSTLLNKAEAHFFF